MKTIKIPEREYEKVKKARKLLVMNGINKLNPKIRKVIEEKIENFDKFTMGIIIGIGATLIIQELEDNKK